MEPAFQAAPELLLQAQGMRALLLDVDGVLTDGGILLDAEAENLKRFHTLDGLGLKLLQQAGIQPCVISGRDSAPLRNRLRALGLKHVYLGVEDKLAVAAQLLQELGLGWPQVAAMGDDWPDLPLLLRAGFSCAPPGAHPELLARAHWVTRRRAGYGAVRECCDLLLTAAGRYRALLDAYLP